MIYEIRCDGCDYIQRLSESPRIYNIPSGENIYIETQCAWCSSCSCGVEAERVRTLMEIQSDLDALIAKEPEMLEGVKDTMQPDETIESALERAVLHLTQRRDWRKSRQSPPKCLECGSMEITPFLKRDHYELKDGDFETVEHSGCGGQLHLANVGFNIPMNRDYYTAEGGALGF